MGPPARTVWACRRTHASAAGSPSAWKHQAAFHRYSRTWTKSMMIGTATLRAWASAWIRSIWWLLPSTSATQVRAWSGSRRSASSKIWATTVAASSTTLAVSHLLRAVGPLVASRRWVSLPGGTHDDAFAVGGQHQDGADVAGGCLPLRVEGVEVDGGPAGEVLDLAFTEVLAGAAFDGFYGAVECT